MERKDWIAAYCYSFAAMQIRAAAEYEEALAKCQTVADLVGRDSKQMIKDAEKLAETTGVTTGDALAYVGQKALDDANKQYSEKAGQSAAGYICPGGCLHNYVDPAPHCPGCAFRCTSYEIGGADNGGLSPAT